MQKQKSIRPPRWAESFLEWYCKPELLEDLQGDLYEYFERNRASKGILQARIIFILDVIKFVRLYTLKFAAGKPANAILFRNYFVTGVRNLKKYPLNTFLNTAGLSLGLASFIVILLYVQFETNYDTHDINADRIYRVTLDVKSAASHETIKLACTDAPLVENLRESFPEIEAVTGVFKTMGKVKTAAGSKVFLEENFYHTDSAYFRVFTHQWIEGSPSTALDKPHGVVLTKNTAAKYFDGEPCLGKTLYINGQLYEVSGVIQDPPRNTDLGFDALLSDAPHDWSFTYVLFRRPQDAMKFEPKLDSLLAENVNAGLDDLGHEGDYSLEALTAAHFGEQRYFDPPKGSRQAVVIFAAVAFLILIISCVNFINLSIAQSAKRQAEMGVRRIFGAMRRHIRMQYFIESLMVCITALFLSCFLLLYFGSFFLPDFKVMMSANIPFVILVAFATLLIAIIAGSYGATIFSKVSPVESLKNKLQFGHSTSFRRVLIFIQFSGSIGLICAATVVTDQMEVVMKGDAGFSRDQVVVIDIPADETVHSRIASAKNSMMDLPFVKGVSVAGENSTPAHVAYWDTYFLQPEKSEPLVKMLSYVRIDTDYFNVLGISFLQGRNFTSADMDDEQDYVIINEALVRTMGWTEPLGKQISYGLFNSGNPATVVGVVKDFNFHGLHKKPEPLQFYLNYRQPEKLIVRLSETSFKTFQAVEDVWKKSFPGQPFEFHLLDDDFIKQLVRENTMHRLVNGFSGIATVIAGLGLFGLINISIRQRMKETSIRKVFGAAIIDILALTWKEYVVIILFAAFAGFSVSYLILSRWIESFPIQTSIGISNLMTAMGIFCSVMVIALIHHAIGLMKLKVLTNMKSE
jgi:putative ABC transport system permease protein